jgi:hypothetical protein
MRSLWNAATLQCMAVLEGHTMAVGTVAFPRRPKPFHDGATAWVVTGSKDKTLKVRGVCVRVLRCVCALACMWRAGLRCAVVTVITLA